jgi:hypothetical protein
MKENQSINKLEVSIPLNGKVHTMCIDLPEDEDMRLYLENHFSNPDTLTQIARVLPAYEPATIEQYLSLIPTKMSEFVSKLAVAKNEIIEGRMTSDEFLASYVEMIISTLTWDKQYVRPALLVQWVAIGQAFAENAVKCKSPDEITSLHTTCMVEIMRVVEEWQSHN